MVQGIFLSLIVRGEYARDGGEQLFEYVADAGEYAFVCGVLVGNAAVLVVIDRDFFGAEDELKAGRLTCKEVVIQGNPRVFKALRDQLVAVLSELRRIDAGNGIDDELLDTIQMIASIMDGMKEVSQ